MITATITRPTSIAATASCDQKLSLVETVDIALMRPPKPRVISLEPISKRARIRRSLKNKESSVQEVPEHDDRAKSTISPIPDDSVSQCGPAEHSANPQSPSDAMSTISTPTGTESTTSSATKNPRHDNSSTVKSAKDSQGGSNSSVDDKTITATIEL